VGVVDGRLDDMEDGFVMVRRGVDVYTEHFGQLGRSDDDGGGVGKAVDHRVRQKIDHQPQPQNAQGQLKDTDHEGQQDGIGNVSGTARGGQRCKGGRCHQ
jgi:hypothetical protein